MTRWLAVVAAVFLCSLVATSARAAAVEGTTLSGGDLKHPVRLTAADELAFLRRINLPPKLDDAPFDSYSGQSYTVTTAYWDSLLYGWTDTHGHAEDSATYYPQGGFVKVRQDGKDGWLVIDLRQQAILNRYIRLAAADKISENPTLQQVIAASSDDPISVDVGSHPLTDTERTAFWKVFTQPLQAAANSGANKVPASANGVWLTFNFPEGRTVLLFYDLNANHLIDDVSGDSLTVPANWLQPVLGANTPKPGDEGTDAPRAIPQQSSTGSPVWWVIMIGGGLSCIAAAVFVRRKLA